MTAAVRSALIRGSVFLALGGAVVAVASTWALWLVRQHIGWPTGASSYAVQDVETGASMEVLQGRLWMADVAAAVAPPLIAVGVAVLLAGGALRAAAGRPVPVDSGPTALGAPVTASNAAARDQAAAVVVADGTALARPAGATPTRAREQRQDLDRYRPPSAPTAPTPR